MRIKEYKSERIGRFERERPSLDFCDQFAKTGCSQHPMHYTRLFVIVYHQGEVDDNVFPLKAVDRRSHPLTYFYAE